MKGEMESEMRMRRNKNNWIKLWKTSVQNKNVVKLTCRKDISLKNAVGTRETLIYRKNIVTFELRKKKKERKSL